MRALKLGLALGSGGGVKPNGNPSGLTIAVLSDTSLRVSHTNGATNHDGTYYYYSLDGVTNWQLGVTIVGNGTTADITGLTENTTYYVRAAHYKSAKISEYSNIANAITYTSQMVSLVARMSVAPENDPISGINNKIHINDTYKILRTHGLLQKSDLLYIFSSHTELSAYLNWISSNYNITKYNNGSFVKNNYIKANGGTADFYKISYNPYANGVNFVLNSACMMVFVLDKGTTDFLNSVGAYDGTNTSAMISTKSDDRNFNSINQASSSYYTLNLTGGVLSLSRTASNLFKVFYNKVEKLRITNQASSQVPNMTMAIGGNRTGENTVLYPCDSQFMAFWAGGGLSPAEIANLEDDITIHISKIANRIGVIGDSTVASYLSQTAVASLFNTSNSFTIIDVSHPGDTILQQQTLYDALTVGNKRFMRYVVVQIGLNDLDPAESAATALGRYQTLINDINAIKGAGTKILLATMTPCKQRLTDVYGATNGLISYQKWLDMNDAIRGNGINAITGASGYVDSHTTALNDGSGNLKSEYDMGDHIHENNTARQIIANAWFAKMQQLEM